jgi:glycosyltransferase involved in cell wall biosynthesis
MAGRRGSGHDPRIAGYLLAYWWLVEPIRVVSIVEAWFVTGQAKNLLDFAQRSRVEKDGVRPVGLSLVTYERGAGAGERNKFVTAAREAGVTLDLVTEQGRFDRSVLKQIRQIVAERKPHIIQTHNVKSHFLMRVSGLWRTHKWLAFHHGHTTTDFKMRCYNQLDRWSLRAAKRVVTVCGAFARDVEENGVPADRIIVRHNSVKPFQAADPAVLDAVRAGLPSGAAILLVVGRLSHEKGHADLLNALDILRRNTEQAFHAVFVGDGPEQAKVEATRARLGLENYVTMAGLQHDVRPYYGIATIVVMPSHSEGSPNVLLEAMAAGVPVVATRVGGVPEIAADGETALLVESRNPAAMAAALQRMLEDEALRARLACKGKTLAEQKYSPDAYRRSLVEIYEKVLAE